MWKVGSKNTMRVTCNTKSNFPISIELDYWGSGNAKTQGHLDNIHGMWFDVSDAMYLVRGLLVAIVQQKAAQHRVQRICARWRVSNSK